MSGHARRHRQLTACNFGPTVTIPTTTYAPFRHHRLHDFSVRAADLFPGQANADADTQAPLTAVEALSLRLASASSSRVPHGFALAVSDTTLRRYV